MGIEILGQMGMRCLTTGNDSMVREEIGTVGLRAPPAHLYLN